MDDDLNQVSLLSKVENVRFLYRYPATSNTATIGTLYLTATHLIFVDPELKRETWILHSLIASVEKLPITTIGSPLLMRCKHFLCITFVIPREKEAHDIYQSLIQLSQPSNVLCWKENALALDTLFLISRSHRESVLLSVYCIKWIFFSRRWLEKVFPRSGVQANGLSEQCLVSYYA